MTRLLALLVVVMATSCASDSQPTTTGATPTTSGPDTTSVPPATDDADASTTTSPGVETGDLVDPDVRTILVDGAELVVAWADTPDERARGLMEVRDLGDLDGMLFDLGEERRSSFTMRNTLIPLDIAFFSADGTGRGVLEMVPCESEFCPSYEIDDPARYALEVPAGSVPLRADSTLRFP